MKINTTGSISLNRSEQDLIEACVRRERWAQKEIYEAFYGPMMGLCIRYSNNKEDALDILHEGYIKVFRNIGRYKPGTSLYSWIRSIMVNTAIDYYRKAVRRRTEDLETVYDLSISDPDIISKLATEDLLEAVQQLTPSYRTVFNMYVVEGYSHKEIGDELGISESTSRSNLVKARKKLQEYLTKKLGIRND